MNERQEKIFEFIVRSYIQTAQPVGSKLIVEGGDFELSSATMRNEMAELEAQGYIVQPYTSAGRIPTEKGYQYYIKNFIEAAPPAGGLSKKQQSNFYESTRDFVNNPTQLAKEFAKKIAKASGQTVFIGFSPNNIYYTGLSNLFSQPEFSEQALVSELSNVIDHLDAVMENVFEIVQQTEIAILIGQKNPFGRDCSAVIAKYRTHNGTGVFGILGPMRMDYQQNLDLVLFGQNFISNL